MTESVVEQTTDPTNPDEMVYKIKVQKWEQKLRNIAEDRKIFSDPPTHQ